MLNISKLSKTFSPNSQFERHVLNGLDLELKDGEFVTIIGSNGAGKSTLFNAICGSILPDSGAITLNGRDITLMPEHKRAKFIGRVFQDPMKGTAPSMTIEENLALAYSRSRKGILSTAITRKDREFFKASLAEYGMGLEDRLTTKLSLLSGGQRQVVTLLMCTIVTPELLLLDEHTAALDPAAAEKIMEITNSIVSKNHLSALMITHNIKSALSTGDRTIMLDAGKIIIDLSGEERAKMTVDQLLHLYSEKKKLELDEDSILFS